MAIQDKKTQKSAAESKLEAAATEVIIQGIATFDCCANFTIIKGDSFAFYTREGIINYNGVYIVDPQSYIGKFFLERKGYFESAAIMFVENLDKAEG